MPYGVTPTGFVIKPLDVIKSEIEAEQLAAISPALNVTANSVFGQLNGIFADKLRDVWELIEAAYNAFAPDSATGAALDNVSAITGVTRLPATASRCIAVNVTLAATTTLPAGSVANVSGDPNTRFASVAAVTNGLGVPAVVSVDFLCEQTGPVQALTGTLNTITQPVAGWSVVSNPTDAVLGRDVETDAALRARREADLSAPGGANLDAIVTDVRQVDGVTEVVGFQNVTDFFDLQARPPHSVDIIVAGGAGNDIAQAIWDSLAAGIQSVSFTGNSGIATDQDGVAYTMLFSRPVNVRVYIDYVVTDFTVDYNAANTVAELVAMFQDLAIGEDVVYNRVLCTILDSPGVVDLANLKIGLIADPSLTGGTVNLVIAVRSRATLDSADVNDLTP